MWPTYYMPRQLLGPELEEFTSCGRLDLTGGSPNGSIPNHPSIQEGDLQIIYFSYATNSTITFPWQSSQDWNFGYLDSWGTADGGFTVGVGSGLMAFRFYTASAPAMSFTVASGFAQFPWSQRVIRNANTTDPVYFALHWGDGNSGGYNRGAMQMFDWSNFEIAQVGSRVYVGSHGSNTKAASEWTTDSAALVDDICVVNTSSGAAGINVASLPANDFQNNLLTNSRTLENTWTADEGLSVITGGVDYSSNSRTDTLLQCTNSSTGKCQNVWQSVTLAADTYYMLKWVMFGNNSGDTSAHVIIEDPSGNYHGLGWGVAYRGVGGGSPTAPSTESLTEVSSAGWTTGNLVGAFGDVRQCTFKTTQAGTYKVRLGVGYYSGTPTVAFDAAHTNTTSRFVYHGDVCLSRVGSDRHSVYFLPTTTAPITSTRRPQFPVLDPNASSSSDAGNMYTLVRRSLAKRPVQRQIMIGRMPNIEPFGNNGYSEPINHTKFRVDPQNIIGSVTTFPVTTLGLLGKWIGNGKFYFEFTVDQLGSGGAGTCLGMGWGNPNSVGNNGGVYSNVIGRTGHEIGYYANGNIRYNNATVATVASWAAADIIGASIDYPNREYKFYRNGSLVHTQSFSGTAGQDLRDYMACKPVHWYYDNTSLNTGVEYTVNYRGPFNSKPIGFTAVDFDNEVA